MSNSVTKTVGDALRMTLQDIKPGAVLRDAVLEDSHDAMVRLLSTGEPDSLTFDESLSDAQYNGLSPDMPVSNAEYAILATAQLLSALKGHPLYEGNPEWENCRRAIGRAADAIQADPDFQTSVREANKTQRLLAQGKTVYLDTRDGRMYRKPAPGRKAIRAELKMMKPSEFDEQGNLEFLRARFPQGRNN